MNTSWRAAVSAAFRPAVDELANSASPLCDKFWYNCGMKHRGQRKDLRGVAGMGISPVALTNAA